MNQKQLDLKCDEYIARNVLVVEVGVFDRTTILMNDRRFYEMAEVGGKVVELASAPVSGPVCWEVLRRMDTMMKTQHRLHGVVYMQFEGGRVTYTRTFMGEEWGAE